MWAPGPHKFAMKHPNPLSKEKGMNLVNGSRSLDNNEAVVPLHPTVPNPYVILGEIPPSAKWLTVLDLKDAFFAYHWLKNLNIFLPLSGRPQEKNTNR